MENSIEEASSSFDQGYQMLAFEFFIDALEDVLKYFPCLTNDALYDHHLNEVDPLRTDVLTIIQGNSSWTNRYFYKGETIRNVKSKGRNDSIREKTLLNLILIRENIEMFFE